MMKRSDELPSWTRTDLVLIFITKNHTRKVTKRSVWYLDMLQCFESLLWLHFFCYLQYYRQTIRRTWGWFRKTGEIILAARALLNDFDSIPVEAEWDRQQILEGIHRVLEIIMEQRREHSAKSRLVLWVKTKMLLVEDTHSNGNEQPSRCSLHLRL